MRPQLHEHPQRTSESLFNGRNETVAEIQAASGRARDAAGAYPSTKKRAPETGEDEYESHHDFVQMDVDRKDADDETAYAQETEDEERATPQPLEDEEGYTTTDDEPEAPALVQPSAPVHSKTTISERPTPPKEVTPPPRRELPFTRRGPMIVTASSKPEPQSAHRSDGEETGGETDDDEL